MCKIFCSYYGIEHRFSKYLRIGPLVVLTPAFRSDACVRNHSNSLDENSSPNTNNPCSSQHGLDKCDDARASTLTCDIKHNDADRLVVGSRPFYL